LLDADLDGAPGLSALAKILTAPTPATTSGLATAYAAIDSFESWLITPVANGKHTATINVQGNAMVVGCTGGACGQLGNTSPTNTNCPQALNKVQFVPVTTSYDTCAEIISDANRNSIFVTDQDGPFPSDSACPPPPP
jgi:hypothetical protein